MLRLATIHRRHIYIATATLGGIRALSTSRRAATATVSDDNVNGTQSLAISSSSSSSTVVPYDSSYHPQILYRDTLLPSFQAARRALRLLKTVSLMVCDYQKARWEDAAAKYFRVLSFSAIGEDRDDDDEGRFWEDEVTKRSAALEKSQLEYTTKTPEWESKTGAERIEYEQTKKEEVRRAANVLAEAEEKLKRVGCRRGRVHGVAARRLLELCRENKGAYIKVGQHLANLDYLIPAEYVTTLSELFDDAPVSLYSDVRRVIKDDLGAYPEDLFASFSKTPVASASLAQVHVATDKRTGRKLAVKVQHRGLRETSRGDLFAVTSAVKVVEAAFKDFSWGWLVDEITPQLPRELDFVNEANNSEKAASHLKESGLDCVVPRVLWDKTTPRVLCMEFEEGFKATDTSEIRKLGLQPRDVAKLISSIFNYQVFESGFVHCDPHPANVLLREHPTKKGKPQVVLVDHGLYKDLDDNFRATYAGLWRALMMADIQQIESSCHKLGVHKMYPLLAAMLTSRPFDEILERSKTKTLRTNTPKSKGDKAMIRGYAQRFMGDIITMLNTVPRQMLLIFKMNDCLRHVDHALGSPMNNLVVAGEYASRAVYQENRRTERGIVRRMGNWFDYVTVLAKIRLYTLGLWCSSVFSAYFYMLPHRK